MATIVTKTIGSAGGRDYATIALWIAGRIAANANFVTADVIEKGVLYPDSDFVETPDIAGATVDSTHYWWLTVSARTNGTAGSGVVIDRQNVALGVSAGIVTLTNNFTRVDGFEIKNIKTAADSTGYFVKIVGTGCVVDGLLIHGATTGTNQRPIGIGATTSSTSANETIRNCMIYGIGQTAGVHTSTGINLGSAGNVLLYNNTVVNLKGTGGSTIIGINAGTRTTNTSINNMVLGLAGGTTNNCFTGTWGTENNDESSDATAAGTGSITNATPANEILNATGGSEDCRLKSGAQAINAGATIGSFSTDIAGTSRPQGSAWCISAFEFVASSLIKTVEGLAIASVKTAQGLATASMKTMQGLSNV